VDPRAGLDVEKRKFLTLRGLELRPLPGSPVCLRKEGKVDTAPRKALRTVRLTSGMRTPATRKLAEQS
jgi:hypothetical protein